MPVKKEKRPPKTLTNPEYERWQKERRRNMGLGYCPEDEDPEEYGKKLPDDGAWIIILTEVRVGRQIDEETVLHITVPHLSMWYALPTMTQTSHLHQAIIQTPDGAVHIWPHEYQIIKDIGAFLEFDERDGMEIHFLSTTGAFDEGAMFYLRSRGISKGEAQQMLLPTLKDPNFCYFTFGVPYLQTTERWRREHFGSR